MSGFGAEHSAHETASTLDPRVLIRQLRLRLALEAPDGFAGAGPAAVLDLPALR